VLYEILTLKHAFHAQNIGALMVRIVAGCYPPVPIVFSGATVRFMSTHQNAMTYMCSLVDSMLSSDPGRRPSSEQLLRTKVLRAGLTKSIERVKAKPEKSEDPRAPPIELPEQPLVEVPSPPKMVMPTEEQIRQQEVANKMAELHDSNGSPLHARIESLRNFLEDRLGVELLVECHAAIEELKAARQNDEAAIEALRATMGPFWLYLPLVMQLVNCEAAC
jgi:serine/threonine protein kinase